MKRAPAAEDSGAPGRQRHGPLRGRVLVHGGRLFAEALAGCLAGQPGLTVRVADGPPGELVRRLRDTPFDLVLVDGGRNRAQALEAVASLADRFERVEVVAVEVTGEAEAVRFVEAGVRGYLSRDSGLESLLTTLHEVRRGRSPCQPGVAALVIERLADLAGDGASLAPPPPEPLTPRELEVLELLSDGLSNKEVAMRLGIALSTVKNHVHNLLAKMGVGRRGEAVKLAYQQGIIDRYLPLRNSVPAAEGAGGD